MKTKKPLKTVELRKICETLKEKTGCRLKDHLIEQAFTRSSYSKQHGGGNNEVLEYIGDTILGYHIVHQLYEHYGTVDSDEAEDVFVFRAHEKDFTALKNTIVSNHTLASIIDEWGLCQYLIVGQSDVHNEVDKQDKIKADLFEAIIGAYAVQYRWKPEFMESIISKVLPVERYIQDYEKKQPRIPEFSADNAGNTLKELAEHEKCAFPEYEITGPDKLGYGKTGSPVWACRCTVSGHGLPKTVFAHSKKDVKKYASYLMLCRMFLLSNEYGPDKDLPIWYFDGRELTLGEPEDF